jgi:hypothetical protein
LENSIRRYSHVAFVQSPLAQAFGKLMQAENDLGHRLGVSGSQSFGTSTVFLGDRRGQVDCFVQPSNQFVQVQLQIEFSWRDVSRSGHHTRFS